MDGLYSEFCLQFEEFYLTDYPGLTMFVFILFMIIMPILLLNMLIAMMTNTFQKVMAKSERDAILQWAKIVVILERTFSNDQLLEYQQKYSVKVEESRRREDHRPNTAGNLHKHTCIMFMVVLNLHNM